MAYENLQKGQKREVIVESPVRVIIRGTGGEICISDMFVWDSVVRGGSVKHWANVVFNYHHPLEPSS